MASESKSETMQAVVPVEGRPSLVSRPVPTVSGSELLIRVVYTGINRLDVLQISGKYKLPAGVTDIVGLEVAGVVVAAGDGCTRGIKVGTRVAALLIGGAFAEYAVCEESQTLVLPDSMSLRTAAAIPETWFTAFGLLHTTGKVNADDTVLVHAAGSGVGTAAIQLARAVGAKVIATAGTQGKLDTAASLGAFAGFNYKEGSWAEAVMKATEGKGVSLILDCVGGSYAEDNSAVIARDGRWVLYGLLGGFKTESPLLRTVIAKRVRLEGSTLRTRPKEFKAKLVSAFAEQAFPKFSEEGGFAPVIDSEYPLADIAAAVDHVSSNKSAGKVLIKVADE